jgi:hypothetical protein
VSVELALFELRVRPRSSNGAPEILIAKLLKEQKRQGGMAHGWDDLARRESAKLWMFTAGKVQPLT